MGQQPIWLGNSALAIAVITAVAAGIALLLLYKNKDNKPGGAEWGWKKTGIAMGIIGVLGWLSALFANSPYGIAIIPGAIDIVDLYYSWELLFVFGIPLGAFWSTRNNKEKSFSIPKINIIGKRLLGGLGLGISGSIAAGWTWVDICSITWDRQSCSNRFYFSGKRIGWLPNQEIECKM